MYCSQETFQVLIIDYINSIYNVQGEIDNILYNVRALSQAYVDDIIGKTKSLHDLLQK